MDSIECETTLTIATENEAHNAHEDEACANSPSDSATKSVNLWQICPFLFRVPSSPEGSVRCSECGDSEQFNDLGSTYSHLRKRHPQQFQQMYQQLKCEPPPKRRPYPMNRQQQQQNANRNDGERAPPSVKVELQETAAIDDLSTFFAAAAAADQQHCSENDPMFAPAPPSSAVWCVGLFQRHHFRNGTVGALCLECGQMLWELDTDTQLTDHIVNKHPEYTPNLTHNVTSAAAVADQQIMPTYVDEQGELWQCLDIANSGESAEELFKRHGARPLHQQQMGLIMEQQNDHKFLLGCAFDGGSLSCCFRAIWMGQQRAIFQSLGHNHSLLPVETMPVNMEATSTSSSESVMETIERVLQQDRSTYVDANGKQWHWLADVSATGGETELRRVCRANGLYREGSARNFSCKWSSRNARSTHNCPLRGLYVPARNAIFHRQNHNHPLTPVQQENRAFVQRQTPSKNPVFTDTKGTQWQFLAEIPAKSELSRVCRDYGLVQNGPRNVAGKMYFGCQQAKRAAVTASSGGTRCAYRALYVAKRKAIFYRLAHNHDI